MKTCRWLILKHKWRGRRVIQYEWHNWQRVLQTKARYIWRPKRGKPRSLLRRIYREDERSQEDWRDIVKQRVAPERPIQAIALGAWAQLEKEWIPAVLQPQQYYSVVRVEHGVSEDGAPMEFNATIYFQFLRASAGQNKEKTMPTFETADEVLATAPLAMCVQMHERLIAPRGC